MRSRRITQLLLVSVIVVAGAARNEGQERARRGQISNIPAEAELSWPLGAATKAYAGIDGRRMKRHVEELVSISRKSRDAGNRYWGRIAGMPSGEEAQQWLVAKFRQAGLEVRLDEFELRTQAIPKSWEVSVSGANKTINLTSASPIISFPNYMPSAEGDMNLETVWVGLGMASDFIGKDVRGKAVFIYSFPSPSSLIQSASWMGALTRAQEKGAAALFVVLAIPGNMSFVSHVQGLSNSGSKLPVFTVGLDDGEAVESLNAADAAGAALKTRVSWKVESVSGLRASNVIGVLPGQTDESIVMISHMDGYFDGANDNAAGLASMVGVAEYFSKRPKEQRRRTMYFVGIPDHHTGDAGGRRLHDTWADNTFTKTAVILNAEHVALAEPVWDRPWGTNARPGLIKTNQLGPSWWGVHGSDRLANLIRENFAMFGVPTQLEPGGSAGELRSVQWDAPSFYLHNKGVYYHSDADTADIVPAEGLRTATQAFAKIFDDINRLELKDLRPAISTSSDSR